MTPEPSPSERRLAAKRNNERVKLTAAFLNTLAVGTIAAAIIVPSFNPGIQPDVFVRGTGFFVGVGLHSVAQWWYRFLRSED